MFENDYIKRLIESIGKMIMAVTSGKDSIESNIKFEDDNVSITEDGLLEIMVTKYIHEGKIIEAENMIIEELKLRKSQRNIELALSFYEEINNWDEGKLKKCNFSKVKIAEGLNHIETYIKES